MPQLTLENPIRDQKYREHRRGGAAARINLKAATNLTLKDAFPCPMPAMKAYRPRVRMHLPVHAQDIYREAFNHASAAHAAEDRREEAAHRIAWAAVKRSCVKLGNDRVARR